MPKVFPERWVGYGLHHYRPVRTTYAECDLASCPLIPDVSDDWAWLTPAPDELDAGGMIVEHQSEDEFISLLGRLQASAPAGVPDLFWRFLSSETLRASPLSSTDCHWELSSEWIVLPSLPGDRFVRFMSDSQYCYSWYLRVAVDSSVSVVACRGLESEDHELESPLIEDCPYHQHPDLEQLVLTSLVTAAQGFSEFIYRIWIEGLIWFHLYRRLPLPSAENAYARQLRPN